jgi:hypothetical protein
MPRRGKPRPSRQASPRGRSPRRRCRGRHQDNRRSGRTPDSRRQACHAALTRWGGSIVSPPDNSEQARQAGDPLRIGSARTGLTSRRSTVSCCPVQHRASRSGAVSRPTGLCRKAAVRPVLRQAQRGRGLHLKPQLGGGLDPGGARALSRQRRACPLPTGRTPVRRDVRALFPPPGRRPVKAGRLRDRCGSIDYSCRLRILCACHPGLAGNPRCDADVGEAWIRPHPSPA